MCVRTVEALLVDDGAACQSFIVLLVTHQGVHTQDGWKTARRPSDDKGKKTKTKRTNRWTDAEKESTDFMITATEYSGPPC